MKVLSFNPNDAMRFPLIRCYALYRLLRKLDKLIRQKRHRVREDRLRATKWTAAEQRGGKQPLQIRHVVFLPDILLYLLLVCQTNLVSDKYSSKATTDDLFELCKKRRRIASGQSSFKRHWFLSSKAVARAAWRGGPNETKAHAQMMPSTIDVSSWGCRSCLM